MPPLRTSKAGVSTAGDVSAGGAVEDGESSRMSEKASEEGGNWC